MYLVRSTLSEVLFSRKPNRRNRKLSKLVSNISVCLNAYGYLTTPNLLSHLNKFYVSLKKVSLPFVNAQSVESQQGTMTNQAVGDWTVTLVRLSKYQRQQAHSSGIGVGKDAQPFDLRGKTVSHVVFTGAINTVNSCMDGRFRHHCRRWDAHRKRNPSWPSTI